MYIVILNDEGDFGILGVYKTHEKAVERRKSFLASDEYADTDYVYIKEINENTKNITWLY